MPTKKKPLRDLPKIPKELLEQFGEGPVSYTHLTLPTNREV